MAGRRYALIRGKGVAGQEVGLLRLVEAPAGAPANRPRPQSRIMEPGLAVIECRARDFAESYEHLKAQGFAGIAPPMFYFFRGQTPPLPDFKENHRTLVETMTAQAPQPITAASQAYSVIGPAGEQVFISCKMIPKPEWTNTGMHGPFWSHDLICADRWPLRDFYSQLLGLKPVADTYVQWETINTMVGAPPGTYFMYGGLGQGLTMEMWEFRQWKPPAQPPHPTSLGAVDELLEIVRRI